MDAETVKQLGVDLKQINHFDTVDELRNTSPGMCIATVTNPFSCSINYGLPLSFVKGERRVMSLFLYQQMEYSPNRIKQLVPANVTFRELYKPYRGEDLTNKTLLVWRTGGIGDLLFIQPNLYWLKKKYNCKILFSCSPIYWDLLKHWKDCHDKLVDFPISERYLLEADYHITFEGVIERTKEATYTNAYRLFSKWMHTECGDDELVPKLYTLPEEDKKVAAILKDNNIDEKDYIVVQIRASSPIRTPSSNMWSRVLTKIMDAGYKIVITDSSRVADVISTFIQKSIPDKYKSMVYNFSPYSKSLSTTISLISKSKAVLAPDSSLIHISTALGIPVVGIYGAFSGNVRMTTYKNADWVEPKEDPGLCPTKGRFCYLHSQVPCDWTPKGKCAPCYDNIDENEVLSKIQKVIK